MKTKIPPEVISKAEDKLFAWLYKVRMEALEIFKDNYPSLSLPEAFKRAMEKIGMDKLL